MEHFLEESKKVSEAFTENLNQKKELSINLLLKLERKIAEMDRLIKRADRDLSGSVRSNLPINEPEKANPAAPENRALVIKLAESNFPFKARPDETHRKS
jgi:hypothetical protein